MNLDIRILSRDINEMLWKTKKTLSTVESCTSGRVAAVITSTPGSYDGRVKTSLLNVDSKVIDDKSSVCEEVARQMVTGANKLFGSDYSIAVTGFAGPGGGTDEAPVGTIWIAVGNAEKIVTKKLEKDCGRDKNLAVATFYATKMFHDYLKELLPEES